MSEPSDTRAFRDIAATLDRIDLPVYETAGRDPLEPIIGLGDPDARVCFFGRDPGRHEVVHGMPFIGAGGQKIRKGLHLALFGREMPDFDASIEAGRHAYWANTVPYKPIGNKVWPMKVRRAMQPLMADLLVNHWNGVDLLPLGKVAYEWFGLTDKSTKQQLAAFWTRDDCFETSIEVPLVAGDHHKIVRLHPLPHPSPLNATWAPKFPGLLAARLANLGLSADTWKRKH